MDSPRLGGGAPRASLARPGLRLRRLERRRGRGHDRADLGRRVARRRGDRPGGSRGVLRLPGEPPDDPPHRGPDARDRVARQRAARPPAAPGAERDLVLLAGTEPNLRWRTFSEGIAEVAEELGVEMVVTLGALIADVAHTLPVPITGLASDAELVERLDLHALQLRGPDRGRRRPPRRLRPPRACPRRASGPRSPTTSPRSPTRRRRWRCCAGSRAWSASRSRPPGSRRSPSPSSSQVSNAVSANPEIAGAGRSGSRQQQAEQLELDEDLPSGESLARDFERYLRQRGRPGRAAQGRGG